MAGIQTKESEVLQQRVELFRKEKESLKRREYKEKDLPPKTAVKSTAPKTPVG